MNILSFGTRGGHIHLGKRCVSNTKTNPSDEIKAVVASLS